MSATQEVQQIPEQEVPWFEREPAPNTARILYRPDEQTSPIVVADRPIETLFSARNAKVEGNMRITVENDASTHEPHDSLGEFLWRFDIPVPGDSPVRNVPDIKFKLTPPPGMCRVMWELNSQELDTSGDFDAALAFADTPREVIATLIPSDEELDVLRTKRGDNRAQWQYQTLVKLRKALKEKSLLVVLDTSLIQKADIAPDPEGYGYELYQRMYSQSADQNGE